MLSHRPDYGVNVRLMHPPFLFISHRFRFNDQMKQEKESELMHLQTRHASLMMAFLCLSPTNKLSDEINKQKAHEENPSLALRGKLLGRKGKEGQANDSHF